MLLITNKSNIENFWKFTSETDFSNILQKREFEEERNFIFHFIFFVLFDFFLLNKHVNLHNFFN